MKRVLGFSLFFLVFLSLYGLLNYYVYRNIIQGLSISSPGVIITALLFVFMAAAYPFSQTIKKRVQLPRVSYVGAFWMGMLSIAVAVFAVKDLLSWFMPAQNLEPLAIAVVGLLTLLSFVRARRGPKLKAVAVNSHKTRRMLSIVHLSDLHLGVLTSPKWLARVIQQVNSLEADLVVITGDMVDDSFDAVKRFAPAMASIRAKCGVYAVSGNHEYYQGIVNFHKFCAAAGITVVDNKLVAVAEGINVLGLDDKLARAETGIAAKISELLLGDGKVKDYNILLVHQPLGFKETARQGIDLQLSGHTHRGQIFPFNLLVPFFYRYAYGLHKLADSYIYTSSGTGTWGPPMRLGSSSEIVKIQVG